jgi:lysine 6-dehydrogenase
MKFLVIGAGMMGSAVARDLARSAGVEAVTLADANLRRAEEAVARIASSKVRPVRLDAEASNDVVDVMRQHESVIAATTFRHNVALTKAAIEAGVHLCDLGGNDEVVQQQLALDEQAKQQNVLILPNCGLAPGLANVLAARGIEQFERVDTVHLRVGGLPQHPKPPLNYQLVFSVEGLINEYSGTSRVLRNYALTELDAMTELEHIEFPSPFGTLEAFITSGGTSLLPQMFAGKVRELDYKTIRYPGHRERFKTLLDIGFASNEPIVVGTSVLTAKEMFVELLQRKLTGTDRDVVLLRVSIRGVRANHEQTLSFNLIDFYDENDNITAMMRTTAYPTSIIAQLVARTVIHQRGVLTPEQCVPLRPLLAELHAKGINVTETWS